MGSRAQVKIPMDSDSSVYLYTHWNAPGLLYKVRDALKKKWRWNDSEYLSRIIFEEMIREELGNETGYGIGTEEHGDVEYVVEVNCSNKQVNIRANSYSFEEFILLDNEDLDKIYGLL